MWRRLCASTWLNLCILLKNTAALMPILPIRVLSYNPLSCNCDDRWNDILDEASNFDCIGLNGTGEVFADSVKSYRKLGFNIVSCGFSRSPLTNRSCGVALAMGTRFMSARFFETKFAGGRITGRGVALRIKSKVCDFTFVSVYFPPVPWKKPTCTVYGDGQTTH